MNLLRGLPREVGVLTAVTLSVALGFGIVIPVLPEFARQFGVGETAAGAVISAFALMRFVSALGSGRLVNRGIGERALLATGIGIVAVSSALAGLAQSYVQLIVLRSAGGVGSALFTVSAFNLLMRVAGSELRGRATAAFQGGFLVGGITGPAIGGLLAPVSMRAPFFVYAGTLVVAGTIGMVFLGPTGPKASSPAGPAGEADRGSDTDTEAGGERVTLLGALRMPPYRAALTANLGIGWVVFGVRGALVPLFVTGVLGRSLFWAGVGFTVTASVQALTLLFAGRIADTRGRRPTMVTGAVLAGAAMLALVFTGPLVLYLAAMAVLGVGASLLGVAPGAVVGDVAGGRSGTVVAFYQMARDFGVIVGPLVAGAMFEHLSYQAAFGASAGILFAVAAMAAAAHETRAGTR